MRDGDRSTQALERCSTTSTASTRSWSARETASRVLRDPIACKPAVMAETDDWVALATEFRAIATLPGVDDAQLWEPAPATGLSLGTARDARRVDLVAAGRCATSMPRPARCRCASPTRNETPLARSSSRADARDRGRARCADQVEVDGHAGYYCAGMNKRATVTVNGNAGTGRRREHDVGPRSRERRRLAIGGRDRAAADCLSSTATRRRAAGSR